MPFIVNTSGQGVDILTVPGGWQITYDSGLGITEAVPGSEGPMATVVFKVNDANQRYSFVNQLLGAWSGTSGGGIVYVGPFVYPPSPNLFCTAITSITSCGKWLPMGALGLLSGVVGPWMFGKSAYVTAVFTRPPWQPATNGGYFTIEFAGNGETVTIPGTSNTFTSNGAPTNTPLTLQVMGAEINVTRYRMPYLPDVAMTALAGYVNNASFQIGNVAYPAGTLLFAPGNSATEADPLGNITYRCQYKFLFKTPGWNYFLNPVTGDWDTLTTPPYQTANFNLLP